MDHSYPMEPYQQDGNAVADYREQSRIFLARAREYLSNHDLHQASEKGWGASAWMAKAVAEAQGWQYNKHEEFLKVMRQAQNLSSDTRVHDLGFVATGLHGFLYTRKMLLYPDVISQGLDRIETLLDILQPLSESR